MTDELLPSQITNDECSIYLNKRPPYEDYAINPFQLEKIVKSGGYRVHINQYDERVFGPTYKGEEINEEITKPI